MAVPSVIPNTIEYIIEPDVQLIGDKTENTITVPTGNETILSYLIGDPEGGNLNQKSLQFYAPCEYDNNGNVISRT